MTEHEKLIRCEFLQRKIEGYQATRDHWAKAANGQQHVKHYDEEIRRMQATIQAIQNGVPVMYKPSDVLHIPVFMPYIVETNTQIISDAPNKIINAGRYGLINGKFKFPTDENQVD